MEATPVPIDGSAGEGGGQVLRTSLALSLATGRPVRLRRIRGRRRRPGLLRQHLACVRAAARVGAARVEGATLGASDLEFRPTGLHGGVIDVDVGSAGSTALVLQTVVLPLLGAAGPSRVTVRGGTHNDLAPPFEFLERAFGDQVRRMGGSLRFVLERHGFVPEGGGRVVAEVRPSTLAPRSLLERGGLRERRLRAVVARLDQDVARRELRAAAGALGWPLGAGEAATVEAAGAGNALLAEAAFEEVTEVAVAFGRPGRRAEAVGAAVAAALRRYLDSGVPVGEHLADQLLLPFALAGGGAFVTGPLSLHARTNLDVIRRFLEIAVAVEDCGPDRYRVGFGPEAA